MKIRLTPVICRNIIAIFNKRNGNDYDFDSHEFISVLRLCYPLEYYSAIPRYMSSCGEEDAIKRMHAEISRYLSEERDNLHIDSLGKHVSLNYRGDETSNEKWRKL